VFGQALFGGIGIFRGFETLALIFVFKIFLEINGFTQN